MEKLLITGAAGLLGSSLAPFLAQLGYTVIRHGHTSSPVDVRFDLSDSTATLAALRTLQPDVILHLAALTNVELCEEQPQQAYLGNVRGVENLCQWISQQQQPCFLLHISTDHVYDGPGPHSEEHVCLSNTYAFSKYTAEQVAARVPATILRTNFFGRSQAQKRQSFSDWIVNTLRAGEALNAVTDILFSPLSIPTLVEQIALAVQHKKVGLFNLGSHEGFSKADFILQLADLLELDRQRICLIRAAELPQKTYRPKDMRMDLSRYEAAFATTLPTLSSELQRIKEQYHVRS
ncbi:MAG: SDR family oxidoreductase [Magnetococcales bacterium]|nr:SDR family oxidoreductase [Magnetococcales bacterium]